MVLDSVVSIGLVYVIVSTNLLVAGSTGIQSGVCQEC